ncbi:MAG TPA: hypothetical protein VF762_15715 [Blastocatellia bacterium]
MRKITCALLVIVCLFAGALAQTPPEAPGGRPATFDERLGDDDGAVLAILISANERGNIEVCD